MKLDLPPKVYSRSAAQEGRSIVQFGLLLDGRGLVPRLKENPDLGVDGTLEVADEPHPAGHVATNLRCYVQLKSVEKPTYSPDGLLVYRQAEPRELGYLDTTLPALFVVLEYSTGKAYFEWVKVLIDNLDDRRPAWRSQLTVSVQLRPWDEHTCSELIAAIRAHATQVMALTEGPGFARTFRADCPLKILLPEHPFLGRETQMDELTRRLSPSHLILVRGPEGSGKKQLVAHVLADATRMGSLTPRFSRPLSLLAVDLGQALGDRPIMRAVATAVGGFDPFLNVEKEDVDAGVRFATDLLPLRAPTTHVLGVFLHADEPMKYPSGRRDLGLILDSPFFNGGSVVLTASDLHSSQLKSRRLHVPPIEVGSLDGPIAARLIGEAVGDSTVGLNVVKLLEQVGFEATPGAVRLGATSYRASLGDSVEPDAQECAYHILGHQSDRFLSDLATIGCDKLFDGPSPQPLATLCVMAAFRLGQFTRDSMRTLALPAFPLDALQKLGLFTAGEPSRMRPALSTALRHVTQQVLAGDAGARQLRPLLLGAIRLFANEERADRTGMAVVEDALSWAQVVLPAQDAFLATLRAVVVVRTADNPFSPIRDSDRLQLSLSLDSLPLDTVLHLDVAIARLILAAAGGPPSAVITAVSACVAALPESSSITPGQLRGLDTGLYMATRVPEVRSKVRELRTAVWERLAPNREPDGMGDMTEWARAQCSWAINTAYLMILAGESDPSRDLIQWVLKRLNGLPVHVNGEWTALKYRALKMRARLAHSRLERLDWYREAVACIERFLDCNAVTLYWFRIYVAAIRLEMEYSQSGAAPEILATRAFERARRAFGSPDLWPLGLVALFASLLRKQSRRCTDMVAERDSAVATARFALQHLAAARTAAHEGDTRALILLARCTFHLASAEKHLGNAERAAREHESALKFASEAVKADPTPRGWLLLLRLQEIKSEFAFHGPNSPSRSSRAPATPRQDLQREVARCREWLSEASVAAFGERRLAALAIECFIHTWRGEGSVLRAARKRVRPPHDWESLSARERELIVINVRRDRLRQIAVVDERFGKSPEALLLRAELDLQCDRTLALVSGRVVEVNMPYAAYDEAAELWPHDLRIRLARGVHARRLWQYDQAAACFERIRLSVVAGDLWRQATARLAETYLQWASYGMEASVERRAELLTHAAALIDDVVGFRLADCLSIAGLREQIALERGEKIDFATLSASYDLVVGGPGRYIATVVSHHAELRHSTPNLVVSLADDVRERYTSSDALEALGRLYLRRVEKGISPEPIADAERAFASFEAASIQTKSWEGTVHPENEFRLARCVLAAVELSGSADPFKADLGRKSSLLHLGRSHADRAISLSVGSFRDACRALARDLSRL